MQLSPSQLDWLVQQVVDQLRSAGVSTGSQTVGSPAIGEEASNGGATLRLDQPLVCLADLPATLPPVGTVELGPRTVVTPAARDRLRHAGLTLTRLPKRDRAVVDSTTVRSQLPPSAPQSSPTASPTASGQAAGGAANTLPLLLLGAAPWWPSLQRSRWPAGVELAPIAASSDALMAQLAGVSPDRDQSLVVVADPAYRLLWEIQKRHNGWCGSVVRDWHELQQVCQQLPANLLVLPPSSWQPASLGNLVRHWHRHRQTSLAERE
jgi:hypothetical protein